VVLQIWIGIASTFAALGGVWALFQIQHHWRYRKPVFKVKRAKFAIKRMPGYYPAVADGEIRLNVRGARWPMTLTQQQFFWGQSDRVTIGHGIERNVLLPAEVWTAVELEAIGMVLEGDPPPSLDCVMYFADDHDFREKRPLRLKLADDGSHYYGSDEVGVMHMMRTIGIRVPWHRRVTRRIRRAFRSAKGFIVKQ
jgi:hypothetical protein